MATASGCSWGPLWGLGATKASWVTVVTFFNGAAFSKVPRWGVKPAGAAVMVELGDDVGAANDSKVRLATMASIDLKYILRRQ